MKIGVLTQSLCQNYGGLLQNYALQQVLIRAGHHPTTIDHERRQKIPKFIVYIIRPMVWTRFFLFPKRFERPGYIPNKKELSVIAKNTSYFIDKYIVHTKPYNTHKQFMKLATTDEYHAYVVGSDQCWRPEYNRSFLKEMFLSFAEKQKDIKRIAYAVSFGIDEWKVSPDVGAECARLVKLFDMITVREDGGVTLCRSLWKINATQVLDPTLLLSKEDYIQLIENENEPQSAGDLFYYILDPAEIKSRFIDTVAKRMGLIPFTVMPKFQREIRKKKHVKNNIEDCIYPSVTSWLRAFLDAKMTIVDSFHGMVFSIIFNKPFFVIGNKGRGMSRFHSLLDLFDLKDRLVDMHELDDIDISIPIDWIHVNQVRDEQRKQSISLLYGALN